MIGKSEIKFLQQNPIFHIEEIQGVDSLQFYQKEICRAVATEERVAIAAAHNVGKTFTMAKIVLWLGSSFPGAKIITTAPTFVQVEKLLWSEIRSGFNNSKHPLGGDMLTTQWKIDDDWFALGMSPKEDADGGSGQGTGSRFQGFHGDMVVIVFDEATGIPAKRWIQAEGLMTSGNVKWLAIGNPTSRNSEFYKCFHSPEWHKIYINCFDSPNLIANKILSEEDLRAEVSRYKALPDDKKRKLLKRYKIEHPKFLTAAWCVSKVAKWGFEHPLTKGKVLGKFPDDDVNAVVKLGHVEAAQRREIEEDPTIRSIGVDPARYGTDSTVITVLEGKKQTKRKEIVKHDTMHVAGAVIDMIRGFVEKRHEIVVVDSTGIGSGVYDALKQAQSEGALRQRVKLIEFHGANKPTRDRDGVKYVNLRAQVFMELGEDLKEDLSILDEAVYLEELPNILYKFDSKGRYLIESKDDYKKRTNQDSPDSADSLALANFGRKVESRSTGYTEEMLDQLEGTTIELNDW